MMRAVVKAGRDSPGAPRHTRERVPGARPPAGPAPARRPGRGGWLGAVRRAIAGPLMLLPVLGVVVGLFGGGLVAALLGGLGYVPELGLEEVTPRYYLAALARPDFREALLFSLQVSLVPTAASLAAGLFIAVQLRRCFAGRAVLRLVFRLPLLVPALVATLMVLTLLTDGGLLARVAYHLGLIRAPAEFPHLLYDRHGIGIMLVYFWGQLAFVALVLSASLLGLERGYEEAARTLGASGWQVFRHVSLPLLTPALLAVGLLNFAFAFGDYATPAILGPTRPNSLPVAAYRAYTSPDLAQRPHALALSVLVALIGGALLLAYAAVARRRPPRRQR